MEGENCRESQASLLHLRRKQGPILCGCNSETAFYFLLHCTCLGLEMWGDIFPHDLLPPACFLQQESEAISNLERVHLMLPLFVEWKKQVLKKEWKAGSERRRRGRKLWRKDLHFHSLSLSDSVPNSFPWEENQEPFWAYLSPDTFIPGLGNHPMIFHLAFSQLDPSWLWNWQAEFGCNTRGLVWVWGVNCGHKKRWPQFVMLPCFVSSINVNSPLMPFTPRDMISGFR